MTHESTAGLAVAARRAVAGTVGVALRLRSAVGRWAAGLSPTISVLEEWLASEPDFLRDPALLPWRRLAALRVLRDPVALAALGAHSLRRLYERSVLRTRGAAVTPGPWGVARFGAQIEPQYSAEWFQLASAADIADAGPYANDVFFAAEFCEPLAPSRMGAGVAAAIALETAAAAWCAYRAGDATAFWPDSPRAQDPCIELLTASRFRGVRRAAARQLALADRLPPILSWPGTGSAPPGLAASALEWAERRLRAAAALSVSDRAALGAAVSRLVDRSCDPIGAHAEGSARELRIWCARLFEPARTVLSSVGPRPAKESHGALA